MHLHAYTSESYWGPAPFGLTGEPSPATAEEHLEATLTAMDRHGVVLGVVSGSQLATAEAWSERAPGRFLKGITVHDPIADLQLEEFAAWVRDGRLDILTVGQYRLVCMVLNSLGVQLEETATARLPVRRGELRPVTRNVPCKRPDPRPPTPCAS